MFSAIRHRAMFDLLSVKMCFVVVVMLLMVGCAESAPPQPGPGGTRRRSAKSLPDTDQNYIWGSKAPGQTDPPHSMD